MNIVDFIFRLLHICNLLKLSILTPFCPPYTPFVDFAHLFIDYENTFGDCTIFSIDSAHNFDDYANTFGD
jgi:hypothetical protein